MFSVSATPFNSSSRQLYGGWTLGSGPGQAGNNVWAKKTYYEMARKYGPKDEAAKARQWLAWWRAKSKEDKTLRKRLRLAGKPFWKDAIRPALTAAQKQFIWDEFSKLPLSDDVLAQRQSAFLRHSPYPNYLMMNKYADLGVPYIPRTNKLRGANWNDSQFFMEPQAEGAEQYRTLAMLQEAFKNMAKGYGEPSEEFMADLASLPPLTVKKQDMEE